MQFGGDLATVPVEGKVLERYKKGNSVFVRGVFPIQDAAGNNVGAMFVVKDISSFYLTAQRTQYLLVIVTVVVIIGATFAFLVRIITVATRLVGGDYASEIKVNSTDEIGQFELLFEQFRLVFIDVLSHIPELQDK
jgi:signal transduction histidine kinase